MGELITLQRAAQRPTGDGTLGDVGPHDDESYGGQTGLGMDYLRDKAREFQVLLNALDAGYLSLMELMNSGVVSPDFYDELADLAADYEAHKVTLKLTAEAINAGAAVVNAAGGRFPQLSLPGTLGALPALPVAAVAALGTVVVLTTWGMSWLRGYNERTMFRTMTEGLAPEERAAVVKAHQESTAAIALAEPTLFGTISGVAKWLALAALGWFAWKTWGDKGR